MSNKNVTVGIDELFNVLDPYITPADCLAAKLQLQISGSIAAERLRRGYSQKEFADFLGVSQGLVSRWEGDDYNFTIKKLAEIADKLDLNVSLSMTSDQPLEEEISYRPDYKGSTDYSYVSSNQFKSYSTPLIDPQTAATITPSH